MVYIYIIYYFISASVAKTHSGAVLNDLGFAPFFDEFLRIYLNPLVKKLYSQYIKQPLTQYHATMVRKLSVKLFGSFLSFLSFLFSFALFCFWCFLFLFDFLTIRFRIGSIKIQNYISTRMKVK